MMRRNVYRNLALQKRNNRSTRSASVNQISQSQSALPVSTRIKNKLSALPVSTKKMKRPHGTTNSPKSRRKLKRKKPCHHRSGPIKHRNYTRARVRGCRTQKISSGAATLTLLAGCPVLRDAKIKLHCPKVIGRHL